jgi:hypothetical protein
MDSEVSMINIDNFDNIVKRYEEYWAKENHDRPLLDLTAPLYDYRKKLPKFEGTLRERWLDIEYVLKSQREKLKAKYFAGEAYPTAYPNLGPDIFAAYFGIDLEFGEDTSWAVNRIRNLEDIDCSQLNPNNYWWEKTVRMTEAMIEESKGDYIVGITDIHPGLDALASLRGSETLCFDIYDAPETVEKLTFDLFERFKEVYNTLNGIIGEKQQGNSNWMGVYHPDGWYVTSCDFMGMISNKMYKEFVEPELLKEIRFLKNTIFHLDGPGALKHIESLLQLEELDGIQWVYGAGQPTAAYWIDILKKMQKAGKMIHVDIIPKDLPILLENLQPEGTLYRVFCKDKQEADEILKFAEKSYKRKIF